MTEVQNTAVSRRRIIQGAAWATPAIIVAAAAPAAAASSTTTPDKTGDHVIITGFSGGKGWGNSGQNGWGGALSYYYQYYIAGDVWPTAQVVPTTWTVELLRVDGTVAATATGSVGLTGTGSGSSTSANVEFTNLAHGKYTPRLTVRSQSFAEAGVVYKPNDATQYAKEFQVG